MRYIYQENAERSAARNRGLAADQGEYIAFLDDDDLYLPHKLATEVAFMAAHPEVDLSRGGVQLMDPSGRLWGAMGRWQTLPEPTLRNCLYGLCPVTTGSIFMRRCVLDRMDHWFDPLLSLAEDLDIFIRVAMAGFRLAWLPQVLSTYRVIHTDRTLRILADQSHAIMVLLDKLFAQADMPGELLAERLQVTRRWRCVFAARAYAYGQLRLAQRELLHAYIVAPSRAGELVAPLAEAIGSTASAEDLVSDQRAYIDYAYDNLPVALAALGSSRDVAWRAYLHRVAGYADVPVEVSASPALQGG
jgi:glycosyltransferase involved in cell wall biosynthesis